ncbi:MAG TPA: aromatic-ring-hydroxylating dioxygenase subunit beta [Phenylobacterium sp.]|uniref:aromatic-ring-hydroxylating dioxygenase subunit beta n=1 Tax=Phenylobacterium sp. TaxID=1871053 RepID=UPI002B4655AB|nr:aromatic-ring-hydroxylating dioxygenase subunit beta [Phenylobacterium sp.]HKR90282.1 aromatic-ring-hydroxylating dioxygenase subunit beta [Phenylobacterium sp.]
MADLAAYHRLQQFLFHEARLMDEHRYDDWLALWDEDAHYWIPCNADDVDRSRHISLVNEDMAGLRMRIARLKSRTNYAQRPPTRTAHVIGNVELEGDGEARTVIVHSTVNITACRRGLLQTVSGRVRHKLRLDQGSPKITTKKITLINNDEVFGNLAFLI